MIDKPTIIVSSLGRTGTKFFYVLFQKIILNGTSLHEPDVFNFIQYRGVRERTYEVIKQLKDSGVYYLVFRKLLGTWSLARLSDDRVRGKVDYTHAVQRLLNQREAFIHSRPGSVYAESSTSYYHLIDVLPDVFEHHRAAYIIRDGRDWVQSWMNWGGKHGGMYGKGPIGRAISRNWPTPLEIEGDPYKSQWNSMSRFQRLCWAWSTFNRFAVEQIKENPYAKLVHFENIFKSEKRQQYFEEVIHFLMDMPQLEAIPSGSLQGLLNRKIHQSEVEFPSWEKWTPEQKKQFKEICGPLMTQLGYELD